MLSGKHIVLGVTGGIAAYKAAILLRGLQKAGAEVHVTITPAAKRFVGIDTFAALSRHDVPIHIFPEDRQASSSWTRHISWGEWADLLIIAPCTANTLAKIAHGLSDNMLTATVAAARGPLLICPTMDGEMYQAPATQNNLKLIRKFGYQLLEPDEGYLASGQQGKGRLPEPQSIIDKAQQILGKKKADGPLNGKKVLVTAGPTREHLDPVRFISNPSSGKMGFAMANAAKNLGANVTLIHGPVHLKAIPGVSAIKTDSTKKMFEEVKNNADADIVIMAAAVSDYGPAKYSEHKIKKTSDSLSLSLQSNPDILKWLGDHKNKDQLLIGFAMETENLLDNARAKLEKKNLNWIVANKLNDPNAGFASDTNSVSLISSKQVQSFSGTKMEVARQIFAHIFPSSQNSHL